MNKSSCTIETAYEAQCQINYGKVELLNSCLLFVKITTTLNILLIIGQHMFLMLSISNTHQHCFRIYRLPKGFDGVAI